MNRFSYNGIGEAAVNPENPMSSDPSGSPDDVAENPELEDFFQRLPANFRWPKPSAKAVAAAVEAIQRMSGGSANDPETAPEGPLSEDSCAGCGGSMPPAARFCVWCGRAKHAANGEAGATNETHAGAQHHYHHHYHHIVPPQGSATRSTGDPLPATPRGKVPSAPGTTPPGRADIAARQVVQDWAQACNTKHLDDLLELYASDATVIRSSLPPVRSLPAIREFLHSLLEAGLGDVEMESLRLDVMGEVALDLGRCKMLVPVAMGKRREERGKYLIVLVRQPSGTWKILADCWSSDLVVGAAPIAESARKPTEPPTARKIR